LGLLAARSADDDILVNDRGEKASFTVFYYDPALSRHMSVVQQDFRRAGVEMKLRLLEEGAGFERGLERKFEMTLTSRGTYFFPDPRQFFHTDLKNTTGNNDIWGFGTPQVDSLIQVYEEGLDPEARRAAMYEIDEIVQEEAFYIPFWDAPFIRLAYWDYVRWPESWIPKRVLNFQDFHVFWLDPARKTALQEAMAAGRALPLEEPMDKDPYGVIPGP
jgi:microcin C transport system substrate-binding protein